MKEDRKAVVNIIEDMLCSIEAAGDKIGIRAAAYDKMEAYIRGVRVGTICEAVGWSMSEACQRIDRGEDLRFVEAPEVLEKALSDLLPANVRDHRCLPVARLVPGA